MWSGYGERMLGKKLPLTGWPGVVSSWCSGQGEWIPAFMVFGKFYKV